MMESAQDVTEAPSSPFVRQIEIRLAQPTPRVRYEKGKPIKEPAPDMNRVIRALEDEVTAAVQQLYGPQTEVTFAAAKAGDIRFAGAFTEKPGVMRERVSEILGIAFDNLDLSGEET
ncbi:hypothetical protein GO986_11935 [Deinococcus sp. HMF7620]|uniref:Uncharacterized protein n=1 Tax=Deinococcus arboris TaxID=2682977 RepID=A0A7C9LLG7_9DEIO|nr:MULTISPECIES: hypothetical protein [Deinococcus]MBZ9752170.1 hypothetical protein [Deinococcus betulae]MVN87478.1 hypothetical protein [Deinococcus arboris]